MSFSAGMPLVKKSITRDKWRVMAYAMLALLAALALQFHATGGRVAYTMDSLSYRDAALNLLAGRVLMATNTLAEVPEHIPFVVWPPAYPTLWAGMAHVLDLNIDRIPILLAPVLLGLTVLCMYWTALMLSGKPVVASLVAAVSAFSPSIMAVYGYAWSEGLFVPLVVLAFASVWKFGAAAREGERWGWLVLAVFFVALANWVRYAGAIFLPLMAGSLYVLSGHAFRQRLLHSCSALLLALLAVAPLWLRNYRLSGNIAGSGRGGAPSDIIGRLLDDLDNIELMFEYWLFNYDTVLSAHLKIPMLAVATFLAIKCIRKSGWRLHLPRAVVLPMAWAGGQLLFLLYARVRYRELDLDYRMLASVVPFLLLAITPGLKTVLSGASSRLAVGFAVLVMALLVHTGWRESTRVHENYAAGKEPAWRAKSFAIIYHDLNEASRRSRALKTAIGELPPGMLVLTDYRALYVRYLAGIRAFAVNGVDDCARWLRTHDEGVLLTGYAQTDATWKGQYWASECLPNNPRWRIIVITGIASHKLILDE